MNLELMNNLHEVPEFQLLLRELKAMRPIIPRYDPKTGEVEMIKFYSAQQEIYDTMMKVINPFKDR